MIKENIKVVELFAGVGGFRVGLEKSGGFDVVWGNQWEPAHKIQHAFNCYSERFNGKGIHSNEDITKAKYEVPNHDLIVLGLPCQNYSVARSLHGEKGIHGEKGVLFWEFAHILKEKKPKFVLFENVDRLLKSPSKQKGRDFAIMLATFRDLNYSVEWRVINAADYGMAQKRRRIFVFAYHNDTKYAQIIHEYKKEEIIRSNGFFVSQFPIDGVSTKHSLVEDKLLDDIVEISDKYLTTFRNSGIMIDGEYYTEEIIPKKSKSKTLGEILQEAKDYGQIVDEKYYLDIDKIGKNGKTMHEQFKYMKGSKKIDRVSEDGFSYTYSEGAMNFPDDLNSPGRTMLTSEATTNRSTHVVSDLDTGRLRKLTPIECELLNGFPPDWTKGLPDRMRYFCMGNALVVDIVERLGNEIKNIVENE